MPARVPGPNICRMRLRWEAGRQGTGYRKLRLGRGRRWDLYLIDYPPGTSIPEHVDPVPGRRHWRGEPRPPGGGGLERGAGLPPRPPPLLPPRPLPPPGATRPPPPPPPP